MKANVKFLYSMDVDLPEEYTEKTVWSVKDRNDIIKHLEKTGQLPIFLMEKNADLLSVVDEINDRVIYEY